MSRPAPSTDSHDRRTVLFLCLGLTLLTLAVFGQTFRFEFVNYDDGVYVYENHTVIDGLTLKGIVSAFKLGESDNWVPLTTISHMLDCQIYGLNAGGHHLTNVLLHTASVILLFLVLWRMTGAVWPRARTVGTRWEETDFIGLFARNFFDKSEAPRGIIHPPRPEEAR